MKRVVDTDTLKRLVFLADGWWNILSSCLRPLQIITLLEEPDPKKAIDFIRKTCNDYCDRLEELMPRAVVAVGLGEMPAKPEGELYGAEPPPVDDGTVRPKSA